MLCHMSSLPVSLTYLRPALNMLHLVYLARLHRTTLLLYIRRWQHEQTKSGPFLISELIACCTGTLLAFLVALMPAMCSLFCCCLCTVCLLVSVALMLALLRLSFSRLCTVWLLVSLALMPAMCFLFCCCLCTVCSLVSLALMLAMCFLFCCCLCSLVSLALMLALWFLSFSRLCTVCSLVSDALLLAFALAFIADLTVRFAYVSWLCLANYICSAFLLARKTCWQDLHTFSLSGIYNSFTLWAYLTRRHALETNEKQMATWSSAYAFSAAIKMADYALAVQCWNHSSFATERFQIKPLEISDFHCPLSKSYRLTNIGKVRC